MFVVCHTVISTSCVYGAAELHCSIHILMLRERRQGEKDNKVLSRAITIITSAFYLLFSSYNILLICDMN